ncbi:MAG: TIGR00725 family protein [Desulfarculaceae bacterium]|nr:TIGR00725 family protein [Desulfarculaceae bacterium]MCF8047803.1 TIGR00725 family protein [Desulfarculaceae bacterium]MCF8065735.1 TIGR00725 family protein [Desulfarculaceae bacterium]MCF8098867.1 TIGR00725 family protein [Desulfarculaceae bacterium]MCF8122986.1 TIGR00725 family protein [Desulfarculaceae bacterium]
MVEAQQLISVIGAGAADEQQKRDAFRVGELLAKAGWGVVCGGLAGVMTEACRGCASAGGFTVGLLPGNEHDAANQWCKVVLPTGLGQARNALVVLAGRGAIAVGGEGGTLSEIGHALKAERPVVSLGSWQVEGVPQAESPEQAVEMLLRLLKA